MTAAEWVERIDRIRAREGFDGGTWETFDPPLPRRLVLVSRTRPACRWCQKPLSPKQVRNGHGTCSISCGQRVRRAS